MDIKRKLIDAATAYDIQQAKKPHYNHYALGQYFMRIDEVVADIERGAPVNQAICRGFNGSLAKRLCKAVGVSPVE